MKTIAPFGAPGGRPSRPSAIRRFVERGAGFRPILDEHHDGRDARSPGITPLDKAQAGCEPGRAPAETRRSALRRPSVKRREVNIVDLVDLVDYAFPMTTEVLVSEKPEIHHAPITRTLVDDVAPRLRGVIKVIFQALQGFHSASRQELQKAAKKQGYSEAELNAALHYLVHAPLLEASATETVSAPANALSPSGESNLESFDSHAAGERLVEELQAAESGAWTGQELQERFNLTPSTLHRRRKEHRILFWRDAQHEFHYPKWQFTESGALLPGVQEVLQTFRSHDEWRLMRYFLGPRCQMSGRRPLDLLRAGEVGRVLKHAKNHAAENTW